MGAKKKLVARILKSEPLILKSKPLIFRPLKTRSKNTRKTQTKNTHGFFQFQETDEYEGMTCKIPSDAYRARRNFVFDVATTVAECSNGSVILR